MASIRNHVEAEANAMLSFRLISTSAQTSPRLATLVVRGTTVIQTPNFIATTSRGVVPHLSPDVQAAHTNAGGVYMSVEDFIEKAPKVIPPVYEIPTDAESHNSRLRQFSGLSKEPLLIVGLRRPNPLVPTAANTNESVMIYTSVGFRSEKVDSYNQAANMLGSDIFIGAADVVYTENKSLKRREKMVERTTGWTENLLSAVSSTPSNIGMSKPALFAPILGIPALEQRMYLDELASTHLQDISGLAVYDPFVTPELPAELNSLPILSLAPSTTPLEILSQVNNGVDLTLPSFISTASEAGLASTFSFPPFQSPDSIESTHKTPLAIDLWPSDEHSTSSMPMTEGCKCYTCRTHTRAYINHLLAAREMLAWTLLQIHNHHVVEQFFTSIRASIQAGTFEFDRQKFEKFYESDLPVSSGLKTKRIRGYEMKSGPGQTKVNERAFDPRMKSEPLGTLPDVEGSGVPGDVGGEELQEHGLGSVMEG